MNKIKQLCVLIAVGLLSVIISGCMVGPKYHPPQPNAVPAEWAGVSKTVSEQLFSTAPASDLTRWWRQFNDPVLNELVEEAVKTNLDLQIAVTRLRQGRALSGIARGGLWPSVTTSAGSQLSHTSGTNSNNLEKDLYKAGFDAVWELDLFGGKRRSVESAEANVEAAIENIRDVYVSLISEVALNYTQLRGFQQEIVIAQKNLKAQRHNAEITHKLLEAGFSSALDAASADADVASTESQIPVLETSTRQAIYTLSVLIAQPPAALNEKLSQAGSIPKVSEGEKIPAGLPSELLRRRPDIRKSEAQLHAATAQIGVAVAQLFPSFSLTGSSYWNSNMLHTWWNYGSSTFSVGPSVNWPIFQGGAIMSNVRLQEALRDEAFIMYQKTVIAAFQDVENALISFDNEQKRRKSLNDATIANAKAVELSLQLYTAGQINFLNVLIAERSLYSSEDALVQSERNTTLDIIALYKALGGGWESMEVK
ncbi:MAG: efflux transporter outer membrane subunit [Nitrospirae bacterium]|nr:efflux transporter outer membrane subunit [Nitrospirota bacterium]MBF0536145.1 efflux transporter outer membrane subunit [Nitrospirota bacterium]